MKSSPISIKERIVTIDVIRGFALFGIFLVNMPAFHSPDFKVQLNGMHMSYTGMDYWVDMFLQMFIQMKFFTIFSFLFGLGFYLFMSRAEQKKFRMNRLFSRRLLGLLIFGLLHLVFLWLGDILHLYAIAGFILLFFYKRKPKTILIWAFSILFVFHALISLSFLVPQEMLQEMEAGMQENYDEKLATYVSIYEQASYQEWLSYRLETEIPFILMNLPFTLMPVLALFLFGLYAGKIGIFERINEHQNLLKKVQLVSFLIGILFALLLGSTKANLLTFGVYEGSAIQLFTSISGIGLCFFYITTLTLLLRKEVWIKRLRPLGYVGQMALTNYLLQTIICVILFLGFNLYGQMSLTMGTLLCFVIYGLQLFISYKWLQVYQFGPFEWLWRMMTYGSIQPIKRSVQYIDK
ncbi:DUF418 domain-containing protein [Metabacillus iocasae]|uniref:DUF418 domain-containing protein n=1 Tax=Priestia iocasae TaxID=2291674 RepID=A0ABS2QVV7_9BACI|nr:DUF418 domain-containing protein [Metabacillus iocasae]MBM7703615.1 uncharacterized protein [Metabacillus iocasae]